MGDADRGGGDVCQQLTTGVALQTVTRLAWGCGVADAEKPTYPDRRVKPTPEEQRKTPCLDTLTQNNDAQTRSQEQGKLAVTCSKLISYDGTVP